MNYKIRILDLKNSEWHVDGKYMPAILSLLETVGTRVQTSRKKPKNDRSVKSGKLPEIG